MSKFYYLLSCFILIILFFSNCATYSITYNKDSISSQQKKGYEVKLNNDKIDINQYHLDENNIEKIIRDNKSKTISIVQKNVNSKIVDIQTIYSENDSTEIDLIVIDGIPIENKDTFKYFIELSSITNLQTLEDASTSKIACRRIDGKYLIINLE